MSHRGKGVLHMGKKFYHAIAWGHVHILDNENLDVNLGVKGAHKEKKVHELDFRLKLDLRF